MIRAARADELALINEIERAADIAFHGVGLGSIAAAGPMPITELLTYQRSGRAWVATNDQDEPVAFLLIDTVDDVAHIEQVSVHPYYARQGRGRDLINHAAAWAQEPGYTAVTLTTYADVPWNAPYYTKLGFRTVPEHEWSPGLRRIRDHETAAGLDISPRVVMRRALTPARYSAIVDVTDVRQPPAKVLRTFEDDDRGKIRIRFHRMDDPTLPREALEVPPNDGILGQ